MQALFHLAFHVHDLELARAFYTGVLGCREGRRAPTWLDIDFFGHQLSLHLGTPFPVSHDGQVADQRVPMPHLGVILAMPDWQALVQRLEARAVQFVLKPSIRFANEPGEQGTLFLLDPSGNPIEIKGFNNLHGVYQA